MDRSSWSAGSAEDRYKPSKQVDLKHQCYDLICVISVMHILLLKEYYCYKKLAFKNNAPFVSCISKNNNTIIDNAEDLDIVKLMYNLIEYSKNY